MYNIYIYIYIYIYINNSWLEHVHSKHEVVGLNPTRASFLYGIKYSN